MSDQENTLNLGDDEVDESDVFYPSESDNFPKGPYESFSAFRPISTNGVRKHFKHSSKLMAAIKSLRVTNMLF